jgi:hypothetical protein
MAIIAVKGCHDIGDRQPAVVCSQEAVIGKWAARHLKKCCHLLSKAVIANMTTHHLEKQWSKVVRSGRRQGPQENGGH